MRTVSRRLSLPLISTLVLLSCFPGSGAAEEEAAADPWETFLSETCSYKKLPKAGSLAGFMGPMQRANTTQTSFAYYRFGNKKSDLPPLVMIDGLGDAVTYWPPALLKDLSKEQEVVVFDNAGQGFSKRLTDDPLTIDGMAEDVVELFDVLGLEQPNVWGYSMGAMIATNMAANHGTRIGKVLAAVGSAGSDKSPGLTPEFLEALPTMGPLDWTVMSYNLNTTRGVEAACWKAWQMAGANQHPFNEETFGLQLEAIIAYFEAGAGVFDKLTNTTTPILLVGGLLDEIVVPENQRLLAAHLPVSWLLMYPEALHDVMIQERDSLVPIMYQFFAHA